MTGKKVKVLKERLSLNFSLPQIHTLLRSLKGWPLQDTEVYAGAPVRIFQIQKESFLFFFTWELRSREALQAFQSNFWRCLLKTYIKVRYCRNGRGGNLSIR